MRPLYIWGGAEAARRESISLLPLTARTRGLERKRGFEPVKIWIHTFSGKSVSVELESTMDFMFLPLMLLESWMQ